MTTTDTPWAVQARGLVKTFGENRAVDGIDLDIRTGAVYGVLGPNGAGKTTTIRMLATLLKPDAGTATVFGRDVRAEPQAVRRLIGVTGQYASVDEGLSATENLVLFARLHGLSRRDSQRIAASLLEEFGLSEAAARPLKNFSGGMRRRLDLAASLIARPPLIFLDEPTTGLDPRTRLQMWDTVRSLIDGGSTVLLTTQYLEEADALADRIAVIDHGRVIADDTPADLKRVVGGQAVSLRPTDPARLAMAARLMERVAGRTPERAGGQTLSVPVDGDLAAWELARALQEEGVRVTEFSLHLPGLDEVFFALTGTSRHHETTEETSA